MFAWTVWCSCVILHVSLQRGQAERFRGNDLLDDYDDDLDGLGTDVWTERSSTKSGTEVPTDNNRTPPGTSVHTANNSSPSGTDVWTENKSPISRTDVRTDGNSDGSGTDVPTDNNVTRPETGFPTDNDMTRPETGSPTDIIVTRRVTDATTNPRTEISKTTASVDARPTGIHTTRFPETAPPDVCQNSSCPNIVNFITIVPTGGNVTLRCGTTTGTGTLWWYRDATFLQRGVGEVFLHIADANRSYSGPYLCVDERGCCILEHRVSVYGVPPYAYHLAVMGAVLAVVIPLCIFLSVRQSSRLGRDARMFNERHGEAEHLIW